VEDKLSSFISQIKAGDEQAILALFLIYIMIMGLISLTFCLRIRFWPVTTGQLLSEGLDEMSPSMRADEQNFQADLRYKYYVDGTDYEGLRLSPTNIMASYNMRFLIHRQLRGVTRLAGDNVEVYYNPSKPRKSFLIRPGKSIFAILAVMIIGPLIYLAFHI